MKQQGRPAAEARAARRRGRRRTAWLELAAETVIVAVSVVSIVTAEWWALLVWEAVAVVYLVAGAFLVWRGDRQERGDAATVRTRARWSWMLPVVSSLAGAWSAVLALGAKAELERGVDASAVAGFASIGVVLSWMLLQVGFANMYEAMEAAADRPAIDFPGRSRVATIDYLYFSFVIGTSFATSDASIRSLPVRRVVMVQSVICFFYNALVVAVAFQVLQQLLAG